MASLPAFEFPSVLAQQPYDLSHLDARIVGLTLLRGCADSAPEVPALIYISRAGDPPAPQSDGDVAHFDL